MKRKKVLSLFIVLSLVVLICTSCGNTTGPDVSQPATETTTKDTASNDKSGETSESTEKSEGFSYPMKGDITLTYFGRLHKKIMATYSSYAELPVVQRWFEKTGVKLEFNTPAAGMEEEQFNIMLASGDYTDIISYDFVSLPGGYQKLYNDGVIIKLTEYMDKYAPNLMNFYKENPHMEKLVKDDNGDHYVFPFLKGGGVLLATTGPMLREDILEELGLEPPETIDEWDTVLQAFKDNYPDVYPYLSSWDSLRSAFQPAYGVSREDWYVDDEGKVHFAPLEEGYKEFLMKMADWYKRGLIDPNFATLDTSSIDNAMSAGTAFATFGAGGSSLGAYMTANKDNPKYSIIGVRVPTLNKGELAKYCTEYEFGGNPQIAITTACENIEAAMRMYDWCFTDEAYLELNWGIEGESFEYDSQGNKVYTEWITNNPDGLSLDCALANYALTHIKAPVAMVQDPEYMLQYYSLPQQQQAMKAWEQKDYSRRVFPPVSYTAEESSKFVSIMADLETYVESMSLKFIMGSESFDNWNSFVNTIKSMNVDEAIQIQQAAVDRFNAR